MSRQPWEVDPDGPSRVLTLAELLIGLQHYGRDWMHCTNLQYLGHDGEPDGPPRPGLMWLVKGEPGELRTLPKALAFATRIYEKELMALADCRATPCDLLWKVPPAPPLSFEESQQQLRELRVDLWLAELGREVGRE